MQMKPHAVCILQCIFFMHDHPHGNKYSPSHSTHKKAVAFSVNHSVDVRHKRFVMIGIYAHS